MLFYKTNLILTIKVLILTIIGMFLKYMLAFVLSKESEDYTMKKRKSVVLKSVANAAYYVANRDANSVCCFFTISLNCLKR